MSKTYFDHFNVPELYSQYPMGAEFLERYTKMSRDELWAFQDYQFRKILKRGWEVPFYQRLWGAEGLEPGDVAGLEEQVEETLDVFPEIPLSDIDIPQVPKPLQLMGQSLPGGVLPKHVLTVNQSFAYTLPEKEKQEFYSFRWLQPPPKGMFFHYDSHSIRWVPDTTQLGAYRLAYHVERKLGEDVMPMSAKEDSLVTYKVVPNLEGDDERLWIYVNDPPLIASEPQGTEFVAGDTFVYKPLVFDRNPDFTLNYQLEASPAGMEINNDGVLTWTTDSTHINVYDVRLVVSDGFDRATQNFSLFARAGVKILSEAFPQGVFMSNNSLSLNSSTSYNPLPPIIANLLFAIFER